MGPGGPSAASVVGLETAPMWVRGDPGARHLSPWSFSVSHHDVPRQAF